MRPTSRPNLRSWRCLIRIGSAALTMALLPVGIADAGKWPIDSYSGAPVAARAPLAPVAVQIRFNDAAPLPAPIDDVALTPPAASESGDTYLLFADGFYARNETSSWMPYLMFGKEEGDGNDVGGSAGNLTSVAEPQLRLGIGLHRRLIDRMDLTVGYRAEYRGPSVIEDDDIAPVDHNFGLRLRYRF